MASRPETGTVHLADDRRDLVVRFPYSQFLVDEVKAIAGRKWDPARKEWRVPAYQADAVFAAFAKHNFNFAPEITMIMAGTLAVPGKDEYRATAAAEDGGDDPNAATPEDGTSNGDSTGS